MEEFITLCYFLEADSIGLRVVDILPAKLLLTETYLSVNLSTFIRLGASSLFRILAICIWFENETLDLVPAGYIILDFDIETYLGLSKA